MTTMTEQEVIRQRALFESHESNRWPNGVPCREYDMQKAYNWYKGAYTDSDTQRAWEAWQAATATIHPVAAPEPFGYLIDIEGMGELFIKAHEIAPEHGMRAKSVTELYTAAPAQAATDAVRDAEYELHQDGMMVAGASGPSAWKEIQHYAMQYGQDGPIEIYEVTRRKVPATAQAATGADSQKGAGDAP